MRILVENIEKIRIFDENIKLKEDNIIQKNDISITSAADSRIRSPRERKTYTVIRKP